MSQLIKNKKYVAFFIFIFLMSCGDNGGTDKITKGHRDAIKIQCTDASNKSACVQEVKENFIKDGNEYADFEDLNKDKIESVQWKCLRQTKYGLVTYNDCLLKNIDRYKDGKFFDTDIAKKPTSNIEKLELSTVEIDVVYYNKKTKKELPISSGSGVIISDKNIATNCHVALSDDPERLKDKGWNKSTTGKIIWVKTVAEKKWAEVKIYKKNKKKDICILRHMPTPELNIKMTPITKFISFDKVKKGSFVRAMGSPGGMTGHTGEGSVHWKGTMKDFSSNIYAQALEETETAEEAYKYTQYMLSFYDQDTKLIVHGATIHKGSSGGPLFDKDGAIIGLNTLGFDKTAAQNVAVSSDHIKDLLIND